MTNLRRDIHSALEVITPPLGGMPERVVQTVLAEKKGRLRKERMVFRLRVSVALVAAVLIAAVGVAAVLTWNSLHASNVSPAGDAFSYQVAQLEARPLHLPAFQSQSACADGPINNAGSFGTGPTLGSFGAQPAPGRRTYAWTTSWGYYLDYVLYSDSRISGPILVRARDLFTHDQIVFIGQFGAGPVVGSDMVDSPPISQRGELLLEANQSKATVDGHGLRHPFVWNFTAGVAKDSSSSSGWQIDGANFSEVTVIC